MKLRWWLLKRIAAWMGLRVGVHARDKRSNGLSLVILTTEDAMTLDAIRLLVETYGGEPAGDARVHREWTH